MSSLKNSCIYSISALFLLFLTSAGYSQTAPGSSSFRFTIENIKLSTDKTIEFDLFLLDTESANPFELALLQAGILINPEIYNGGTLSVDIVEGSSQLKEAQQPLKIFFDQSSNIIKLPSRTLKPLSNEDKSGSRGSIISAISPGTRICKIKLKNSLPFSKVPIKIAFSFTKTPYSTSIFQYISGINTSLLCNETNCIVKP